MTLFKMGNAAYMKEKNKRFVLQIIKEKGPLSRSEVAEQLTLSKPTVSALVEELIAEGWIFESGSGNAGQLGGRRPIQLVFNQRAAYIIGIDIGGTKTLIALSDLAGNIITAKQFSTQHFRKEGFLEKIKQDVYELLQKKDISEQNVLGMGIGVPGITDVKEGIVIDAPSLEWVNYPLKQEAQTHFPFPIFIDNDVNVAVLGEQWIGAAKGMGNVVLISIGTGIGCGIILNGQLYRGTNWAAGEIGYLVTDKNKAQKQHKPAFEGYGFLDSLTGGPAIVAQMKEAISKGKNQVAYSENLTAKDVFEFAIKGEPTALHVINEVIDHIGFAIANVISIINPEVILLGGGISKSSSWYLPRIEEIVKKYASVSTSIKTTTFGENLGAVGAVSLVIRENESALKTY